MMFFEPPVKEEFKIVNSYPIVNVGDSASGSTGGVLPPKVAGSSPAEQQPTTKEPEVITYHEQELEQLKQDYNCPSYTACLNVKQGTTPFPYAEPSQ
jgi:hypothetical protein